MSFPELDERRSEVMGALARLARTGSGAANQKLLGVKGDALAAARAANRDVAEAPTRRAIDRYTGVLYDALAYRTLPAAHRRRADRQVLIVSGLWGLVAPPDPIPIYKLKMGATLPKLGRLSSWWRASVSDVLDRSGAGRTVWNLLPNEHAAAWRPSGATPPRRVVTARFLDEVRRNGRTELVAVNHWNKLLKGSLVRFVLASQADSCEELADFEHPLGYVLRPDLCDPTTATFVKPQGQRPIGIGGMWDG